MPEISIIVPVYNVEKYLHHCVDSILAQTFTDFELLLIDDGSSDNSGTICDEYAAKDNRVQVFHIENGGVSSARNLGLDNAQGKYIMFCDSDDFVARGWVETLYEDINYNNSDMAICGYYHVSSNSNQVIGQSSCSDGSQPSRNKFLLWQLKEKSLLCVVWNKMFRASVINDANLRFEDGLHFSEDELFVLSYLNISNYQFIITSQCLNYYRLNVPDSLTHRYINNLWSLTKRVSQAEFEAIYKCGIPFDSVSVSFYSSWIWSIVHSIQNNLLDNSPFSWSEMIRENHNILHSKECAEAFKYGSFKCTTPIYRTILKTRSAFIVWLFHHACKLKQKIHIQR